MNKFIDFLKDLSPEKRDKDNTVLMVDGLNTFLRSFTMINHLNPKGNHIGGLTGFLKSIGYAIKILGPTKVIITFDGVGSTSHRKNIFPEYKANRHSHRVTNYNLFSSKEEEDESINEQIAKLINYLRCLPVHLLCIDNTEADDLIGYLSKQYEQNSKCDRIYIMSADQDFMQLVSGKVRVYSPVKKKIFDEDLVYQEYGVKPYNFLTRKILSGDSSDNIPGVYGLGPKKLDKLFPELGYENPITINEIYDISQKKINEHFLYQRIIEQRKQLDINNTLMSLHNISLHPQDISVIDNELNRVLEIKKYEILSMYNSDGLGESIPNLDGWINNNFLGLIS